MTLRELSSRFLTPVSRGGGDQALEQVDFIVGVHALQHGGDAFQAHAGIDTGTRQARHVAGGVALELHEHQVPDLDVAVAVFLGRSGAAPHVRAVVVEDFRARTAGAGVGHLPEVVGGVARALVVADADDPLGRHADFLGPDVVGLVVFLVHRDPQLLGGQLVDLGQQLPGVRDGVALEVVAEAEVAQHLEERVVARGVAHVFQVIVLAAGPHATLRRRRARIRARPLPVNTSLNWTMPELVKSRVGSLPGTSDDEGTMVCPLDLKNCRNCWRISEDFIVDDAEFRRIFDYIEGWRQWSPSRTLPPGS